MGLVSGTLMLLGLGFSGPSLILYGSLVFMLAENVRNRRTLSLIALSIGLPWTVFLMYTFSTHLVD